MQLGAFPIDSAAMNSFTKLYEAGRGFVILLLPTVVLLRFCINLFFLKGTEENMNVIKDLVMAAILFGSFMFLINGITQIPSYYGDLLKDYATYELQVETEDTIGKYVSILGWIMVTCYWFCYLLYFAVLGLTCAFGAYIIVAGTLFQSTWVLKATFWCLILLASWPIGWYTINILCNVLIKDQSTLTSWLIVGLLSLFKLLIPIVAGLKIWSSDTANTLRSATKVAVTGSKSAFSMSKMTGAGSARTVFGQNAVDRFANHAKSTKNTAGVVAKATASTAGEALRSKFSSGVRSTASFAHNKLPNSIQTKIANTGSQIKTATTPAIDQYGKPIPLSSPVAASMLRFSPKTHAKAITMLQKAETTPPANASSNATEPRRPEHQRQSKNSTVQFNPITLTPKIPEKKSWHIF